MSFSSWSDERIREVFDAHPEITMARIAGMTGRTVSEIRRVLCMGYDLPIGRMRG